MLSLQNILPWNFLRPGFRQTASTNHTRVTDRVEMAADWKLRDWRREWLRQEWDSPPLLVNHNSCSSWADIHSHELHSGCQVFPCPGNNAAWTPTGEESQVLERVKVCLGSDLPHLLSRNPKKDAATSALWLWTKRNEPKRIAFSQRGCCKLNLYPF